MKGNMNQMIVNTPHIRVMLEGNTLVPYVRLSEGQGWIEMERIQAGAQGLVTALQLSVEVCAGKFFPRRVVSEHVLDMKLLGEKNE